MGLAQRLDLGPLASEVTFGLNRIYLAFDTMGFATTYYVSVNRLVIEQCAGDITQLPMPKFLSWACRDLVSSSPTTTYIPSRPRPHFSKNPEWGVWEGATVTYVALQLAYFMGFSQVILVGVDHSFKTKGPPHRAVVSQGPDQDHFSPDYFGKGFRWQLPDLERSERAYRMARRAYEHDRREVLDATAGGNLMVFRKVDFETLF